MKKIESHKLSSAWGMPAKWLRMGFDTMAAPTRDVLWIEAAAFLKCSTALITQPLQLFKHTLAYN